MSAEIFTEHLSKRGRSPAFYFSKVTSLGVFNFKNIEARILQRLEPIEKFSLAICKELTSISRIELHLLSGHSFEICEETLNSLEHDDLIRITEYSPKLLELNLKRISDNIGDDWATPVIQRLLKRKYLKTYTLTDSGEKALRLGKKLILDSADLDMLITARPLHLIYGKAIAKPQGYETIEMTPDMVYTVLTFASEYAKDTGVEPISLTSGTIASGIELVTSHLWVGLEKRNGKKNDIQYYSFISSNALDKWIPIDISNKLLEKIPAVPNLNQIITNAISYTYDMVKDIILDNLELVEKNLWKFTCDLEMLMLVNNVDIEPIRQIQPEVRLKLQDSDWDVYLNIELVPEDDLAKSALEAARFHSNVSRGGFRLSEGYDLWQEIFEEWNKLTSFMEYKKILDLLVENQCLREVLPEIKGIIIDMDNILSYNRRGSQILEFNRLRQIKQLIDHAEIEVVIFVGTPNFETRVDEEDMMDQWKQEGLIEIQEINSEIHPAIETALEKNYFYLGNRKIPTEGIYKDMRRNMRFIKFQLDGKKIMIPRLEPLYEFNSANILELLYDQYYE